MDLPNLIAESLSFAQRHLKKEGMVGTLIAGFTHDNRSLLLEVPWDSEQEQATSEMLLKMLFAMEGVKAYTAMSESSFQLRGNPQSSSKDRGRVLLVIVAVNGNGHLIGTVPIAYTLEGARIDGDVMLLPDDGQADHPEEDRLLLLLDYEGDSNIRSVNRVAAQRFLRQFGLDPSTFSEDDRPSPPAPNPGPTLH